MRFVRRIGPNPHARGRWTSATPGCPDVWELHDGSFAIIGADATETLKEHLPANASCGDEERIIIVPRTLLTRAKPEIPDN